MIKWFSDFFSRNRGGRAEKKRKKNTIFFCSRIFSSKNRGGDHKNKKKHILLVLGHFSSKIDADTTRNKKKMTLLFHTLMCVMIKTNTVFKHNLYLGQNMIVMDLLTAKSCSLRQYYC